MMVLVAVFDVTQNVEGLLSIGGIDHHLLETTLQGSILLDGLAILVKRSGTDALYLTTCKGGLEHIGRVHRACGRAGTHDGVYLVDEEDDLGMLL